MFSRILAGKRLFDGILIFVLFVSEKVKEYLSPQKISKNSTHLIVEIYFFFKDEKKDSQELTQGKTLFRNVQERKRAPDLEGFPLKLWCHATLSGG